jgi:hypothetical protein
MSTPEPPAEPEFENEPEHYPILDQRVMTGARPLRTAEGVRQAWQTWSATEGFIRHGRRELSAELVDTGLTIKAYVNEGRWVADCPLCAGGIATWPANPDAACLQCGSVYRVEHPSPEIVREAEAALFARPVRNRHWVPEAETTQDLRHDNIRRGFRPRAEGFALDQVPPPPSVGKIIREQFSDEPAEAERLIERLRREGLL